MKMEDWMLKKMYRVMDKEQQEEMIAAIEYWIPEALYSHFHLHVLRFYKQCRKDVPVDHLLRRLKELTYTESVGMFPQLFNAAHNDD